tara:strand:- start:2381 stop:3064 length:684 start_codon:yes stop_codon:yes gene_type:complete
MTGREVPWQFERLQSDNRDFTFSYFDDERAREFVGQACGRETLATYDCFLAGAYKADVFRYCALYALGGVYVDSDLILVKPIDHTVRLCQSFSFGIDRPHPADGTSQAQMKILASVPRHPVLACALERIVRNVRRRIKPSSPLNLTGPALLASCLRDVGHDAKPSYVDAHAGTHPYNGLISRSRDGMLGVAAFERAKDNEFAENHRRANDYSARFYEGKIYAATCAI